MTMGSQLRQYIHEHCGTIASFSDDLGYPRKTVSNWCCDRACIPIDKMAIIAEYLADEVGMPPHSIVLKLVMAHTDVQKVVKRWQRNKLKQEQQDAEVPRNRH
jgi:hypothetical protein